MYLTSLTCIFCCHLSNFHTTATISIWILTFIVKKKKHILCTMSCPYFFIPLTVQHPSIAFNIILTIHLYGLDGWMSSPNTNTLHPCSLLFQNILSVHTLFSFAVLSIPYSSICLTRGYLLSPLSFFYSTFLYTSVPSSSPVLHPNIAFSISLIPFSHSQTKHFSYSISSQPFLFNLLIPTSCTLPSFLPINLSSLISFTITASSSSVLLLPCPSPSAGR